MRWTTCTSRWTKGEVRQPMLKAFVSAVEFVTGLTPDELRDLRGYALACGM